jgi:O-antigen/teichoic acid export membrane protein
VKIVRHGKFLLSERIIGLGLGLVSVKILTDVLSPQDYGRLAMFTMAATMGLTFLNTWISQSIPVIGRKEYLASGSMARVYGFKLMVNVGLFLLLAILFWNFESKITSYVAVAHLLPLLFFYLLFNLFLTDFQNMAIAMNRLDISASINIAIKGGYVLGYLILYALFYWAFPVTVEFFIVSNIIVVALLCLISYKYLVPPALGGKLTLVFDKAISKRILLFSLPLIGIQASYQIYSWIDQLMIKSYHTFTDVGMYQFLYIIFNVFWMNVAIIPNILSPYLIAITDDKEKFSFFINKLFCHSTIFLTTIYLIIGTFHELAYLPFNKLYARNDLTFRILFISCFFSIMASQLGVIISSYERTYFSFITTIGGTLLNILVDFLLVPKFGMAGAACGTLSAFIVELAIVYFFIQRYLIRIRYQKWITYHLIFLCSYLIFFIFFYDKHFFVKLIILLLSIMYPIVMILWSKGIIKSDYNFYQKLKLSPAYDRKIKRLFELLPD